MTRVKICGVTRPGDAKAAADLGAWACGMILSSVGPRALDAKRAEQVRRAIPSGVLAVGVFVDEPVARVNELARALALDLVQLHGSEPPGEVVALEARAVKTIGVGDGFFGEYLPEIVRSYEKTWGFLFDTSHAGKTGGTGRPFAWDVLDDEALRGAIPDGRLILAGGLTAENVGAAIARVRPFAVDVASGVESSPGVKDRAMLERFFAAARGAA